LKEARDGRDAAEAEVSEYSLELANATESYAALEGVSTAKGERVNLLEKESSALRERLEKAEAALQEGGMLTVVTNEEGPRESELEAEVKRLKAEVEQLKAVGVKSGGVVEEAKPTTNTSPKLKAAQVGFTQARAELKEATKRANEAEASRETALQETRSLRKQLKEAREAKSTTSSPPRGHRNPNLTP